MQRIGLLGGSFNPIHNGHLHLACAVKEALCLDGVLLMPTGEAPHKSSAEYAPAADRLAMCRLAAEPYPWMCVSDFETAKAGKSYTVETLRALTKCCADIRYTLLIGSDMLLTFDEWREWQEILRMAALCAVSREAGDLPMLQKKAGDLRNQCPYARIRVLTVREMPVSSTQIRSNVKKNADSSCLLPENVVKYIEARGLYREEMPDHAQND